MALVLVLCCLVILTGLVVSFLLAAGVEMRASANYQATTVTQQLKDLTVNLVQAEITTATSVQPPNTWASQPGAIWDFDGSGNPSIYRLYSWTSLNIPQNGSAAGATLLADPSLMANYWKSPALWVDLNQPSSSSRYPIVDPKTTIDGFYTNTPGAQYPAPGGGGNSAPMPVMWLYVLQNGEVIAPDSTSTGSTATFASSTTKPSVADPIVGRIAYWTDDETCKVNVNTAGGDNSVNVNGGISTINSGSSLSGWWYDPTLNSSGSANYGILYSTPMNNAASATFWDTPRFNGYPDIGFAINQPLQGEYQRYPGHPASVQLNYLLDSLLNTTVSPVNFYSLTPRYTYGGSKEGTVSITASSGIGALTNSGSRLYTSPDEMLFQATSRSPSAINTQTTATSQAMDRARFFLTAHSVAPEVNLYGLPRISMWPMAYENVSLSSSSPVPNNGDLNYYYTPIDQTMSLCSTLLSGANAYPYYFTRTNAIADPTLGNFLDNELPILDVNISRNQALLSYLDYLTQQPVPGFGGTFSTKYRQTGDTGLAESRQILTEIFDYIRSINTIDPTLPVGGTGYPQYIYARGTPSSGNVAGAGFEVGSGEVIPTMNPTIKGTPWTAQGFGTFPRLVEADLQFVALGKGTNTVQASTNWLGQQMPLTNIPLFSGQQGQRLPTTNGIAWADNVTPPQDTTAIQAYLLLNFINPANCFPYTRNFPVFMVEVKGLNGLALTTDPNGGLQFPSDATTVGCGIKYGSGVVNGYVDFTASVLGRTLGSGFSSPGNTANYPFYSGILPLFNTNNATNMAFSGGTIDVYLYPPKNVSYNSAPSQLLQNPNPIQHYSLNFPGAIFPMPYCNGQGFLYDTYTPVTNITGSPPVTNITEQATGHTNNFVMIGAVGSGNADRWYGDNGGNSTLSLYKGAANGSANGYLNAADTVEGVVLTPRWSDARMLATTNIPASAFTNAPNYGSSNLAMGLTLPGSTGVFPISTNSPIISGAKHQNANASFSPWPLVPPGNNSGVSTGSGFSPPDFDNGIGSYPDGPYINKTDEGVATIQGPLNPNDISYFQWVHFPGLLNTFYAPNRQVPSPGVLGSLSTGIDSSVSPSNPKGWQTLLFQPGPSGHPGKNSPEDELLLDLFWMPVTDPYPMSEEFATAGKINLNYEIVPFTYMTRSTALRALLNSEMVPNDGVLTTAAASTYKNVGQQSSNLTQARIGIFCGVDDYNDHFTGDNGVMEECRNVFMGTIGPGSTAGWYALLSGPAAAAGNPMIFRSPAEICDLFLHPTGESSWTTPSSARSGFYGNNFALVGDNVRERAYTDIYGKITTKSNTYRVYYTVQALKPTSADMLANQWNENHGTVTGQYIGATTVERYLDPAASIPDYAANPSASPNLDVYYRWRVVEDHQFIP